MSRDLDVGPGFVRARECPDCFHTRCGEGCVCNCDAARAESEAARLRRINAELLEALNELLPWAEGNHDGALHCDCDRCIALDVARSAIAKAEGRS